MSGLFARPASDSAVLPKVVVCDHQLSSIGRSFTEQPPVPVVSITEQASPNIGLSHRIMTIAGTRENCELIANGCFEITYKVHNADINDINDVHDIQVIHACSYGVCQTSMPHHVTR